MGLLPMKYATALHKLRFYGLPQKFLLNRCNLWPKIPLLLRSFSRFGLFLEQVLETIEHQVNL